MPVGRGWEFDLDPHLRHKKKPMKQTGIKKENAKSRRSHSRPRYGFSTWILRDVSLEGALSCIENSGFDALELAGTGSALLTAWEKDCKGVMQTLESMGVTVYSVHCSQLGRNWLDSPDTSQRRKSLDENLRYFERMYTSGIPELVLHAGGDTSESASEPMGPRRDRARESLHWLAERAAAMGLKIAAENAQKQSGTSASIEGVLDLIRAEEEHVGLCHDVGHSVLAGLDPVAETIVALNSGRLFSLHLHDVTAVHSDHVIPRQGNLPLDQLIGTLDAVGFPGGRTLEIRPSEADIPTQLSRMVSARDRWLEVSMT